jgi:DNA-binding LacI/PurR family transcriptional regulator
MPVKPHLVDTDSPIPAYHQIYQSLQQRIEAGEFEPDEALPPERQLLQDYGVSRITITKALELLARENIIRREHGRGTFVNPPDPIVDKKAPAFGFVSGTTLHPYLYSIMMGAAGVAANSGYRLHAIGLQHNDAGVSTFDNILAQDLSGVLFYPRQNNRDLALCQRLLDRGIQVVMVDRYYPELACDRVIFDDQVAAFDLTRRLIDRGHRRIAVLSHYETEMTSTRARHEGYKEAMRSAQLPFENLVWPDVYADFRVSAGQIGNREMRQRLARHIDAEAPTAILATNGDVMERLHIDLLTLRSRANATAESRSIDPYRIDIAAITYKDWIFPTDHQVITAMQPGDVLGSQGAKLLIERVTGQLAAEMQEVKVPLPIRVIADES